MKKGWKYIPFEKSIVKVKKQKSIKSKDYKEEGQYPVVSQESSLISGYFDDASVLYKHDTPVVIFGDHTQNVKYIDFDFIVGADGVHILSPIAEITPKFFYYQLKSIKLRNLGYARHYKLLKQESIGYPPLSEQERIVSLLDAQFAKIDAIKANAEKQLQEAKALFQSALKELSSPKEGWKYVTLRDVISVQNGYAFDSKLFNGIGEGVPLIRIRDLKKFSSTYTTEECSPEYKVFNGDLLVGMDGDFNVCLWQNGNAFLNQRVCKIIPSNRINLKYLYYFLPFPLKKINDNTAFATVKHLSSKQILTIQLPLPPLSEQQQIAEQLDKLSTKIQSLQSNFDTTITLCNDLKQSILKDIFG